MAKNVELLLLETVENLGIVGDVVKVKSGYARNYLLPLGVAEPPSARKIESLKGARAVAQAELAALRSERERLVEQLTETTIALERSCNDQGALYGSVTQRDISDALMEAGHGVDAKKCGVAKHLVVARNHITPPLIIANCILNQDFPDQTDSPRRTLSGKPRR